METLQHYSKPVYTDNIINLIRIIKKRIVNQFNAFFYYYLIASLGFPRRTLLPCASGMAQVVSIKLPD
jgi:hypothetical protein